MQVPEIQFCGTNFLRAGVVPEIQFCGTNFLRADSVSNTSTMNSNIFAPRRKFQKGRLSLGCQLCQIGQIMPIYVTMKCNLRCHFCPISRDLLQKDVCVMLGQSVSNLATIVERCKNFRGASLSGGEPLVRFDRVINIIRLLKREYGEGFHIHMYTNGSFLNESVLVKLEEVGLDEIRPSTFDAKTFEMLAHTTMDVTIETPVAEYRKAKIMKLMEYMETTGLKRLVLTEMEVTKANLQSFLQRGYKINFDKNALEDSTPTAMSILEWASTNNIKVDMYYCTAKNSLRGALLRDRKI
jgi:pyruvate formate-lyase activating enzyme-like uncharacterized protein